MIGGTALHITQQYQQVATTPAPGYSTDEPEGSNRSVRPIQAPEDTVSVSAEGRNLSRNALNSNSQSEDSASQKQDQKESVDPKQSKQISSNDEKILRNLQARDREVKAHEQAHLATAGQYARGGASFTYQRGPDGRVYAVGGEVSIDVGAESSPEATVAKMQTVRRSALAPAQPSSTDRQVAAQATARLNQAQQQVQQERMEEIHTKLESDSSKDKSQQPDEIDSDKSAPQATSKTRTLMAETYKAVNEYL